ncbi:MAG: M23 family metallopeptidase [Parvularculaceae bacterium]|nr:M23 family metallopeptidase [Parvularculaceae bacterium]
MSNRRGAQSGRAVLLLLILLILAGLAWWWWKNGGAVIPPVDDPVVDEDDPPADDEEPPVGDPVEDPVEPAPPPELTDADGAVFSFLPVGDLLPSSGPGLVDETVYRSDIGFPTEDPVYLNSQVYRFGGGQGAVNGMNGAQCDARNYEYPWQDTFCEKRDRNQPLCPGGGHEGLDIRPHTCAKNTHWAIAVEDARVIDIRRHWVTLQTDDGTIYNYLHLNMGALSVTEGQQVMQGDRIGTISNDFYKSDGTAVPTTTHLHFEMYENYVADPSDEPLFTKVNPYMTLVSAYARKLGAEE